MSITKTIEEWICGLNREIFLINNEISFLDKTTVMFDAPAELNGTPDTFMQMPFTLSAKTESLPDISSDLDGNISLGKSGINAQYIVMISINNNINGITHLKVYFDDELVAIDTRTNFETMVLSFVTKRVLAPKTLRIEYSSYNGKYLYANGANIAIERVNAFAT